MWYMGGFTYALGHTGVDWCDVPTHRKSGRMVIVLNNRLYLCLKGCLMDLSMRARAYLWSYFVANLLMGATLISFPGSFQSQSFEALKASWPLQWWGGVFLVASAATFWGAYRGTERPARWALLANLVPTGGFFAGFTVALIQNTSSSPSGVVAWGLLTVINFIMMANPLRTPFEDMVKEIIEGGE